MLVLDASVTATWIFRDEANEYGERVLRYLSESVAVVPAVWPLEVANALLVGERRRRITEAETGEALALIEQLSVRVAADSAFGAMRALIRMGRREGLSSYDASYLDLARRERLPLATLDERVRTAARELGIALFQ